MGKPVRFHPFGEFLIFVGCVLFGELSQRSTGSKLQVLSSILGTFILTFIDMSGIRLTSAPYLPNAYCGTSENIAMRSQSFYTD